MEKYKNNIFGIAFYVTIVTKIQKKRVSNNNGIFYSQKSAQRNPSHVTHQEIFRQKKMRLENSIFWEERTKEKMH